MSDRPVETPTGPYVGPRPIQAGEPLFGRQKEKTDLSNLLRARRVILLHSPSGAGKTSLIQAGLIPVLNTAGFQILPVIRLNQFPPSGQSFETGQFNRYLFSALFSLENGSDLTRKKRLPLAELIRLSELPDGLDRYLQSRVERQTLRRKDPSGRKVLIFDQFEEILTLDPVGLEEKKDFFVRLAPVLSNYSYWHMFAMRDDFIAGLDPYLSYFPERLGVRFRLEFLAKEPAMEAIRAPVRRYQVEFEEDAAKKLVNDLSKIIVQEMGRPKEVDGLSVEPVQLQVVCKRLWEASRQDPHRITLKDYYALGSVENALRDYYDGKIAEVAEQSGKHELYLREWIERQLITPQGLRNQVLAGTEQEYGLDEAALRLLSNVYLIRKEERRGMGWYELAHDRLVDPILQANAAWRQRNRIVLRTPAELGTNLEDTGWGVIFPGGADAGPLIEALRPLLAHRCQQATRKSPARYQEFKSERGYRPEESAQDFLQRHGAGFGQFNPDKVPYYLLIVGSPQEIPFDFQYSLDGQYAVGRIHFDSLEDYRHYARSVVLCESGEVRLPNRSVIFAPRINDDPATRMGTDKLAKPLSERLPQARPNWSVEAVIAEAATKQRLAGLLGGPETPAILLTVSHGMPAPGKEPARVAISGAIVCQDWPGPKEWRQPVSQDFYFSADDLGMDARLLGLVAFLWGSYTGGVPQFDEEGFIRARVVGEQIETPREIAPYGFLSRLPVQMLCHPDGGALAAIGLTWLGWAYAYETVEGSESATIFDYTLERLMQGSTVGKAMEMINQRSALFSTRLFEIMQSWVFYGKSIDYKQPQEIIQYLDARDFIVIGDPAVRLPVDPSAPYKPADLQWQRSTFETAALPEAVEAFPTPQEAEVRARATQAPEAIEPGEETAPPEREKPVAEGYPPSDFPRKSLDQKQLDSVIRKIKRQDREAEQPVASGAEVPQVQQVPKGVARGTESRWVFNGLDASTGQPWLPPMDLETFAQIISKEQVDKDQVRDLRYLFEQRTEQYSIVEAFDPRSLDQAGWGVIFAPDIQPEVRDSLQPLLAARKDSAGELFRAFEGAEGYRAGDTALTFLARHGLGRGPVDPVRIPYYLCLVGDANSIPFEFQTELSRRFAVGRLWFDETQGFSHYVESLLRAETSLPGSDPRLALFAPQPPDDRVSQEIIQYLVDPLKQELRDYLEGSKAQLETVVEAEATKARLKDMLVSQRPDLLFIAGQGLVYPPENPLQRLKQGGLVCQDWPGPLAWSDALPDDFAYQGQDVDPGSDLCGALVFLLNSYSLGTLGSKPLHSLFPGFPSRSTPAPFIAHLPQRLLSAGPGRGALGVVGLVDHAWSPAPAYWPASTTLAGFSPWQIYRYILAELLDGSPVGHSLRPLQQFFALAFVEVATILEDIQWGKTQDPLELAVLWAARNDFGSLALLGDPAARLNVARFRIESSF